LLGTAALVRGADQPFDKVIWREAKSPGISSLYVVLTDGGGRDAWVRLVVRHAAAALNAAEPHAKSKLNIVFLVRLTSDSRRGAVTGFSPEQLQVIAKAPPEEAERLVSQHAWSLEAIPTDK
jgi:hypothetical protein